MKKNQTLLELLAGIILLGILIQIVHLIVTDDYLYHAIGLWSGIAVACFWAIHMQRSIEDALDLGEDRAKKKAVIGYATRMLISLIVLGVVIYYDLGNVFSLFVGVFLLKISAYLHPFTHKLFLWVAKCKNKK